MNLQKKPMTELPNTVWTNPVHYIACGFGSGALPWVPGTWGTLIAIPFYLMLCDLTWPLYLAVLIISTVLGIWCCDKTARDFGVHDHSGIVLDEILGYWLTMFLIPPTWPFVIAGFVLFRIFDILKPWPIRWIDKQVKGGFGIVLDDLLAGLYSWIILMIFAHVFYH